VTVPLRRRLVRADPVWRARRTLGTAAAPALRGRLALSDHAARLQWVRRLVPGSLMQYPEEIVPFAELAAAREPARICEIGTLYGGASLFLCGLAPSVREFIGLDIQPVNDGLVAALAPRTTQVTFVRGSSREPHVRAQVESLIGEDPFDLLFIDGDHSLEGVSADFREYRQMVRAGGLIAFHDIVSDHGERLGRPSEGWAGDVPTFWCQLRERFRHWEFVRDWNQDGLGIGVIENNPEIVA
jgi:cephalosporin hydroxylase